MNICLGPVVDASAYAFAPQVIVAPFACLDVIFNAITAPYTLRWQQERVTRAHVHGTALVAVGAIFTSVFAQADNIIYNVYELEEQLFFRPTSLAYLAVELVAIASVNLALRKKLLSPHVRGISLGIIAGVLMGNVFFLKGVIGLIQTSASTGRFDAWLRPTPYILAAAAGGGAIIGHLFMRKGLGEYKGVFMVTIFEGAHISAGCLSGCIVMEEMAGAPWWRYLMYWFSVMLIIAGMLVINKRSADAQIEGKFHIAQSFAEVPDEDESHELYPPVRRSTDPELDYLPSSLRSKIGRPLEEQESMAVDAVAAGEHGGAIWELKLKEAGAAGAPGENGGAFAAAGDRRSAVAGDEYTNGVAPKDVALDAGWPAGEGAGP
mmetsp:Transcript_98602/g.299266  ORF Transcript_98602/g.299266 Transcript_98602/m.299266 type:complete len:378 (+) Transcript_98602:2-1135(+)